MFFHPLFYHLLHVPGNHHKEVKQHRGLMASLHYYLIKLQAEDSKFSGENLVTIVAQMRDQARAITEETHATNLTPRIQLVNTLL